MSSFNVGFLRPKKDASGTNTGDATALAEDIALGVTAYAKGVKVVGTGAKAKRYAEGSGTATASASFAVTGLAFRPAFGMVVINQTGAVPYSYLFAFNDIDNGFNFPLIAQGNQYYAIESFTEISNGTGGATVGKSAVITNDGFSIPAGMAYLANKAVKWKAWGI